MKNKTLYMISASYPYGKGENFLYKELKELSKYYDKIIIIPEYKKPGETRWIPDNAIIDHCLIEKGETVSKKEFFKYFPIISSILMHEIFKSGNPGFILKKSKLLSHYILIAVNWSKAILQKHQFNENDIVYSVWNDEAALCCAILKKKGKIADFSIRLHGFDLYDERHEGNYLPFRNFIFKYAKRIFVVSKAGLDYMLKKNVYPQKLVLNYSGIYHTGQNPGNNNLSELNIVSCGNINDVKRVDLIARALLLSKQNIQWFHFGDGPLRDELNQLCARMPANIKVHLMGHVKNQDVLKFYGETPLDLFVHVSKTEGLVLALVEAQSFGIPVLACEVGGVPEIIDNHTAYPVPVDITPAALLSIIESHKKSVINSAENRKKISEKMRDKFDAERNYFFFNEKLQGR